MSPTTSDAGSSGRPAAPPAPKGWYVDWTTTRQWRWWSGTMWTEHVHPRHADAIETFLPEGATETRRVSDLRGRLPAQSLLEHLRMIDRNPSDLMSTPSDELNSWYAGAVGERHVAWLLQRLGPEWTALHSVPVGTDGSDIDHVLIGPPGMFTLNTKHHPGKSVWVAGNVVQINGQYQPYIRNAVHEARRAQRLLSRASGLTVETTGIIVLVGARQLTIKQSPEASDVQVRVARDSELLAMLQQRRGYSDAQLERIVAAAARPGTWSARPLVESDREALLIGFAALEQRMSSRTVGEQARPFAPAPDRARSASPARRSASRRKTALRFQLLRTAVLVTAAIVALNYMVGNIGGG